ADADSGEAEDADAEERRPLTGIHERRRLADLLRPLDAEEIDANHRSPTRRSARPTATAAVDVSSAGSPSFFASHVTVRNGSNSSTGALKRSWSISWNPSTRDAPPLRITRSICSEAAVALKKSNVFWI